MNTVNAISDTNSEIKPKAKRAPAKKSVATKTTSTRKTSPKPKVVEEEVSLDLPANPFVFEVLQLVNAVKAKDKKVEVLKRYEHPSLKSIFIWNFDENVVSMLPEGDVPYSTTSEDLVKTGTVTDHINKEVERMEFYKNNSVGYTEDVRARHTSLRTEHEKMINFVKSRSGVPGNSNLSPLRRESMFIEMLGGLHPLDAEIMCLVKDKRLQTKYSVTKEIISEAYSDITWEQNR
jgi:hypothetical protein